MKKTVIAVLLAASVLTACGKSEPSSHSMEGMDHGEGGGQTVKVANAKQAASVQAQFAFAGDKAASGQDTTLTVRVQDEKGKPIEKFDVQHEKQMHLIIVSKDLSFFNHIHPEYKGKGEFTVTTRFPAGGDYEVIADIAPSGMGAMNKSKWMQVQGETQAAKPVVPDTQLVKTADGKEVTLSFDHLMANMELSLNFHVKDAASKKPVTNLEPYLGAVGHVVILSEDGGNYLHVHPVDEKTGGPDAKFMTTFPHSGVYKIWGQFQQNGTVFTVPYVVKVP